jgi:hypothetical protein
MSEFVQTDCCPGFHLAEDTKVLSGANTAGITICIDGKGCNSPEARFFDSVKRRKGYDAGYPQGQVDALRKAADWLSGRDAGLWRSFRVAFNLDGVGVPEAVAQDNETEPEQP